MAVVSLRITTRFQCEIHLFVQAVEFIVHKSPILSRNLSAVHVFRGFLVSTIYRALFRSLIRRFIRTRVYMVSLLKRTDSRPTSSSRLVSYLRLWCTAVNNPVASPGAVEACLGIHDLFELGGIPFGLASVPKSAIGFLVASSFTVQQNAFGYGP